MPQLASCSECGFGFLGGHSHHTGSSPCVCLSCLTLFACRTKSASGPNIGEKIEIYRISMRGKRKDRKIEYVPTGVWFTAERGESFSICDSVSYLVHYPIDRVCCPQCSKNTLSLGFQLGDSCPRCRSGKLNIDSDIEY